jgi:predicted ATPase
VTSQIEAVEFARYRGFREGQRVSLSRLTLIYGENNAGKSALVRIPALLAGSRAPGRAGLNLDTAVFRGAGFLDLKWRGALAAEDDPDLVLGVRLSDGTLWRWTLEWVGSRSNARIRILEVSNEGNSERFEFAPLSPQSPQDADYLTSQGTRRIVFDGLIPREAIGALTETRRQDLSTALDHVTWLGSLRKGPLRAGSPRGARGGLAGDGDGAAALILADAQLRQNVSHWFRQHTGYQVHAESLGADLDRLVLSPMSPGHDVPFPDAGEGLQQVFPVITALEQLRQQGGLLTIEEPESHLHPRLQRALAELMVSVLNEKPAAKIVLETHSEVLLLAALSAAATSLTKEVGLLWVEVDEAGAGTVEDIALDDNGRPTTSRLEQAFATMGLMRRRLLADRKAHATG